jgi:hypothetical protein
MKQPGANKGLKNPFTNTNTWHSLILLSSAMVFYFFTEVCTDGQLYRMSDLDIIEYCQRKGLLVQVA